jgi:hypothetical protein
MRDEDESGESDATSTNRQAQQKREWEAANTEAAKHQKLLDYWWSLELNRRAEAAWRARRPDEIPERGEYSPIARYEREIGRR